MSAFDVLLESGGWGLAVALAGVVALVGSIATGVALLKGRRVAAWVPTALLSLPSLVGVAAVWTCDAAIRSGIAAGQGTLAEVGPTLATRVSVPFIGGVLTVLAAASLLVVCAVVGARGGPRRVP